MLRICNTCFFSTATTVRRKRLNITFIRTMPLVVYSNHCTAESCVTLTNCNTDQYNENRKWPSSITSHRKEEAVWFVQEQTVTAEQYYERSWCLRVHFLLLVRETEKPTLIWSRNTCLLQIRFRFS